MNLKGERMKHDLKIWPQYFERVNDGSKTFELRENDRGFQPGDIVTLQEWDPKVVEKIIDSHPMGNDYAHEPIGYTGRSRTFKVGYVLPVDASRVVFSLLTQPETGEMK